MAGPGLRARAEIILTPIGEDIEMGKRNDDIIQSEDEPMINNFAPAPAQKGLKNQIIDAASIILNIASTVILVFLNKWCVSNI